MIMPSAGHRFRESNPRQEHGFGVARAEVEQIHGHEKQVEDFALMQWEAHSEVGEGRVMRLRFK